MYYANLSVHDNDFNIEVENTTGVSFNDLEEQMFMFFKRYI